VRSRTAKAAGTSRTLSLACKSGSWQLAVNQNTQNEPSKIKHCRTCSSNPPTSSSKAFRQPPISFQLGRLSPNCLPKRKQSQQTISKPSRSNLGYSSSSEAFHSIAKQSRIRLGRPDRLKRVYASSRVAMRYMGHGKHESVQGVETRTDSSLTILKPSCPSTLMTSHTCRCPLFN
jgi:hypothetical protein